MKLIDYEGNLFGIINIIDLFVILVIVSILITLITGIALVWDKPITNDYTVSIEVNKTQNAGIENIQKQYSTNDLQIHKITNTKESIILNTTMKLHNRDNKRYYQNQRIAIGKQVQFDLDIIVFEGSIRDMQSLNTA